MCILCVIQKWSRRVATMLPWLVIPLIGLWALSQLLPPAFRFEITSPRLACVFVLLVTLFWYEILMPQLSAWRVRRNARLRERKRFEAIALQKLRKTATRRCRNCLTAYRDQNPGGGKFMCSYCGHISKRPVLDLPVPPGTGLSNSGILKDLVGKGGKILNGKVWSDSGWMCGQDWLENGNWAGSPVAGKSSSWQKNGGSFFGGDDHCLAEKSYSRVVIFSCKALTALFLCIMWILRKLFRINSSSEDTSTDAEHRGILAKGGENGANCNQSKGDKARRKAEEKRQARLEKEQLEEEERKLREEVARLVEERRKLRDEKMEAEKDRGKGSPTTQEKDSKKEAEKKRQERKKEKDRGSSKSNSDAEELEKRTCRESERSQKGGTDRRELHRSGAESAKPHSSETGHGFKGAPTTNHVRGNTGTRYLDRMRGTILSSSRAFTGGGFFGKGSNTSATASREHKSNGSLDHALASATRREVSQPERVYGKPTINGDEKNVNRPVLVEPQPCMAPKKSWQQLFTGSATNVPTANSNVISRPNMKSQAEVQNHPFSGHPTSKPLYDNPINFGLPSPFTLSTFPLGPSSSNIGLPLTSEALFPRIGDGSCEYLPEESEIFEDPRYVPDPVSLLGPVSESLDNFQLDLGFVADTGLEKPSSLKTVPAPSEVNRPSPIESPLSRPQVFEERHASSFLLPSTPKANDKCNFLVDESNNANEKGTWQMWNTSPLGQDGLGLVGGSPSWLLPPEPNRQMREDVVHPTPQKSIGLLLKKEDNVLSSIHSQQQVFLGNGQNSNTFNTSIPGSAEDPWLQKSSFGPITGNNSLFSINTQDDASLNEVIYGSPCGSATDHLFEMSSANTWAKNGWTVQGAREGIGNTSATRPHVGGLYSTPDVQSLWSYE